MSVLKIKDESKFVLTEAGARRVDSIYIVQSAQQIVQVNINGNHHLLRFKSPAAARFWKSRIAKFVEWSFMDEKSGGITVVMPKEKDDD